LETREGEGRQNGELKVRRVKKRWKERKARLKSGHEGKPEGAKIVKKKKKKEPRYYHQDTRFFSLHMKKRIHFLLFLS
jgi:hypothetical protein